MYDIRHRDVMSRNTVSCSLLYLVGHTHYTHTHTHKYTYTLFGLNVAPSPRDSGKHSPTLSANSFLSKSTILFPFPLPLLPQEHIINSGQ